MISSIMGVDVEIITDEKKLRPKNSEVYRLFGDNSRLKELTKWEPKFIGLNGFKEGLKITIDWFSDLDNLSKYSSTSNFI